METDISFDICFAYTETPHLVVSGTPPYAAVWANNAFCRWSNTPAEDLLHESIFPAYQLIVAEWGLGEKELHALFEQVATTKTAARKKAVNHGGASPEVHAGSVLEVYPVVGKDGVSYLVLAVMDADGQSVTGEQEHASGANHQTLEPILDSLANVIIVLDVLDGGLFRFSFVNRAFYVTTGLPVERVIGSYVHEIIPEPSYSLVRSKYQEAIRTRQKVSWQEITPYPTGQKTGEVVVVPVFDGNGDCERLVGMVHDITEHKEAEARQARLSADLFQHNRDLQQFTYILSHNVRAPVAYALGLTELLGELDKHSSEFDLSLSYLRQSVIRLDSILVDLNHILSTRDKNNILENEALPLTELCQQVISDLSEPLRHCGGQVHLEFGEEAAVRGYRTYLHSIFYNLLSNSIKYRSPERTLQVHIRAAVTPEGETDITFTDNGSGFDLRKEKENVFKLYKRFHLEIEGKGIGLFLVKTHVEALGGHIEVSSQVGAGTSFFLHFK